VQALLWDGSGADALIFWCTHGLDGRWMIEATYMGEATWAPQPYVDPYAGIQTSMRRRLDSAVWKVGQLPTKYRKYQIIQFFKILDELKKTANNEKLLIIEYLQQKLADIYPE
jgi:hypothetical protein